MNAFEKTTTDADAIADLEYALHLQATAQRDSAFEKRIGAQTDNIRERVLAAHGVLDVAVDLIREDAMSASSILESTYEVAAR